MPDSNLMPHPEMLGLISKRTQNTFNSSNINQNPLSVHPKNTKIYSAQQKKSNQNQHKKSDTNKIIDQPKVKIKISTNNSYLMRFGNFDSLRRWSMER